MMRAVFDMINVSMIAAGGPPPPPPPPPSAPVEAPHDDDEDDDYSDTSRSFRNPGHGFPSPSIGQSSDNHFGTFHVHNYFSGDFHRCVLALGSPPQGHGSCVVRRSCGDARLIA